MFVIESTLKKRNNVLTTSTIYLTRFTTFKTDYLSDSNGDQECHALGMLLGSTVNTHVYKERIFLLRITHVYKEIYTENLFPQILGVSHSVRKMTSYTSERRLYIMLPVFEATCFHYLIMTCQRVETEGVGTVTLTGAKHSYETIATNLTELPCLEAIIIALHAHLRV